MRHIIVLPHWIEERLRVSNLTKNSLQEVEDVLNDDELLWVMGAHTLIQGAIPFTHLHQSERIRTLSAYELSPDAVILQAPEFLRSDRSRVTLQEIKLTVVTTISIHVALIAICNDSVEHHTIQLARQISDNTSFSEMCKTANGVVLHKYIN